jgi:hypothetical protein
MKKKLELSDIPPPPSFNQIDYDEEIKKLQKAKMKQADKDIEMLKNLKGSLESKEIMELGTTKIFLKESISKVKLGGKYDGYILYRRMSRRWSFIKVENFKDVYKMIHKHYAYIVDNIVGYFDDGKPFFIIDERIPITLNVAARSSIVDDDNQSIFDGKDLCYDSKAFYVYLDTITLKNLTPKEANEFDFMQFLRNYWWVFVIIVAIMMFLFLTPMGKDMINKIAESIPKNVQRN